MKTKVCYIPAIKHPHLSDPPKGRIVSIMGNGISYTARDTLSLEVQVYYRRLFVVLLALRIIRKDWRTKND